MQENKKNRLKKEVILTGIVIVLLIVVYVCTITVKVRLDKETNTQEQHLANSKQSPLPSPVSIVQATIEPTYQPETSPSTYISPVPSVAPGETPVSGKKPDTSDEKLDDATKELFKDSVFIGDSRTEGLQLKTGLTSAKFITHRGLTVSTAMTETVIPLKTGKKGTVIDALKEGSYKKVFVMFGVNELGWPYTSTFQSKYEELIATIQEVQPGAEIYIQSIIPVTKKKSDSSEIYNQKNVKKFNKTIKAMTKDLGLHYIDVQTSVTKAGSYLPEDKSIDGVHLNKSACFAWLNYITDYLS